MSAILLSKLAKLLAVSLLCASLFPLAGFSQEPNQQRPRRVGDNQSTKTTNQATGSDAEEVDEGDVLRVETQLVSVPAVVTTTAGRPLTGLKRENFLLFEDGRPQTITNFGTTDTPFEIALLLDTSGSTRDDVALIRQAANAFIESLRPGDRVGLVAFTTRERGSAKIASVEVLAKLTDDRRTLRRAIGNLGSSNGTPFYDALEQIVDAIFREPATDQLRGRRAVVALTDGVDSTSDSDYATARAKLMQSGVACYFVQVNTEEFVEDRLLKDCQDDGRLTLSTKQLDRYRSIFVPGGRAEDYADFCALGPFQRMQISRDLYNLARREMNDLAKVSSGRNFVAASLQDARAAFAKVAAEIGTQYSLGYYPSNKTRDGKFRSIQVEIRGVPDKTKVRAREGYYATRG